MKQGCLHVEPPVAVIAAMFACLAASGDVWAYATPILHASRRSTSKGPRRVLQVDYSAERLPDPLALGARLAERKPGLTRSARRKTMPPYEANLKMMLAI